LNEVALLVMARLGVIRNSLHVEHGEAAVPNPSRSFATLLYKSAALPGRSTAGSILQFVVKITILSKM
jgi:hypothetical protein